MIDINHWRGSTVKEEDLLFQLHLRGAGLTEEQEQQYSNTKKKGKGKKETGRTYLVGLVEKLINSGKWTTRVNDELLRRMGDWRVMKGKGKASESVPTQEEKTQKEKREAQFKELEDKFPLNDYSQVDLTNISFTDMTALFSYAIKIKKSVSEKTANEYKQLKEDMINVVHGGGLSVEIAQKYKTRKLEDKDKIKQQIIDNLKSLFKKESKSKTGSSSS